MMRTAASTVAVLPLLTLEFGQFGRSPCFETVFPLECYFRTKLRSKIGNKLFACFGFAKFSGQS
ncbi:MAG: hypothetical protein MUC59_11575 [Saprospiraceae bacterium]|jgi:hypothetical protein|nr:hypothetical protein [Saprospiraceae bacterium]